MLKSTLLGLVHVWEARVSRSSRKFNRHDCSGHVHLILINSNEKIIVNKRSIH